MGNRSIDIPGLLHVDSGCLGSLGPLLAGNFDVSRVLVCCGSGPSHGFADEVAAGLRSTGVEVKWSEGCVGRLDQAAQLAARVIENDISLLVGVGGGRVIDTVKLGAARTGTEFVSVPTTIAHDGISSPVASLETEEVGRHSYAAAMPAGIVVDMEVIAMAPDRTTRAGAGDLASNLTAILDWRLADAEGLGSYDAFSAMIAQSAALPVLDLEDLTSPDDLEVLARGLLLSGLAMASAGTSRPCSGAEHLISHSLDRTLGADALMHGEQVALGALFSAAAHGSPLLGTLHDLYSRIGLASDPGRLGISDAEFLRAVRDAPATRPERHTILSDMSEARIAEVAEMAFSAARV